MSHASTAAKVRESKERHPELYCPDPRCLWRTVSRRGNKPCPKHQPKEVVVSSNLPPGVAQAEVDRTHADREQFCECGRVMVESAGDLVCPNCYYDPRKDDFEEGSRCDASCGYCGRCS